MLDEDSTSYCKEVPENHQQTRFCSLNNFCHLESVSSPFLLLKLWPYSFYSIKSKGMHTLEGQLTSGQFTAQPLSLGSRAENQQLSWKHIVKLGYCCELWSTSSVLINQRNLNGPKTAKSKSIRACLLFQNLPLVPSQRPVFYLSDSDSKFHLRKWRTWSCHLFKDLTLW